MANAFETAIQLCELGYSVIPSGGGDNHKAPLYPWKEYQERRPEKRELENWQYKDKPPLWGIVTGAVSGLVVLDADTPEALAALQTELGIEPHILTPRGGGHWYFKHPGQAVKTTVGIIDAVDIRADGGFVNIAGSRPDGGYSIIRLPQGDNLLPWDLMPERIRQQLNGGKPVKEHRVQVRSIPDTTRNATLISIAGAMRRQGANQAAIEAALLNVNTRQCQPPLEEKEVLGIAKSAARYEPEPDTGKLTLTDVGNSERLVNLYGNKLRYSYDRNLWLIFTGKRWEWDAGGEIVKLAKETARSLYHEAAFEPDDNKRDALAKHAKASEGNQRIKGMIELARAELSVTIEVLNANQYLLNVNNGTVNLRTGELRAHDPSDLLTFFIPLDYKPGIASKVWHDFLYRIFEENERLIRYVQKSLGYSITGCQDEQALWFLHGPGSNGKTTLTGVILDVLGDYAIEIDPLAFVADKNARAGPNEAIASLYNKRFVAATEVKTGMTLDVAILKRMTGGESLRNERKFEHGFNFKPTHKLWLSGNHEPRIIDTTNSIWNRLKYITFKVTIDDKERIKGLRNRISREHGEAVLAWLVEGCLLWQSEGLGEPPEVKEAIQAYRDSQDILHDFLVESCFIKTGETVPVADMYKEYKAWAEKNDTKPIGKNTFGSRLKEKGFETQRGNANQLVWYGIRLLTPEEKVTLVTLVTGNPESPQEISSCIETSGKKGNKDNKSNKPNTGELPDCPACGRNEWVCLPSGEFQCPCSHSLKGGEKQC